MMKDEKYDNYAKFNAKCQCGHSVLIFNKKGYRECKHCGRLIFINKRYEMKYKQREMVAKLKRDLGGS